MTGLLFSLHIFLWTAQSLCWQEGPQYLKVNILKLTARCLEEHQPCLLAPAADRELPQALLHLNARGVPALVVAEAVVFLLNNLPVIVVISEAGTGAKLKARNDNPEDDLVVLNGYLICGVIRNLLDGHPVDGGVKMIVFHVLVRVQGCGVGGMRTPSPRQCLREQNQVLQTVVHRDTVLVHNRKPLSNAPAVPLPDKVLHKLPNPTPS